MSSLLWHGYAEWVSLMVEKQFCSIRASRKGDNFVTRISTSQHSNEKGWILEANKHKVIANTLSKKKNYTEYNLLKWSFKLWFRRAALGNGVEKRKGRGGWREDVVSGLKEVECGSEEAVTRLWKSVNFYHKRTERVSSTRCDSNALPPPPLERGGDCKLASWNFNYI